VNRRQDTLDPAAASALEARFALKLTARLSEQAQKVGPDIGERLRVAREQALERARHARAAQATPAVIGLSSAAAAILSGAGGRWWITLGSALPLLALVAGLLFIQDWYADQQIAAAAEIDASLLADDLPPKAYGDSGFVEFLKTPGNGARQ